MFTSRAELLDKEETTAEHLKNHKEETERLDKDKANKDPRSGGLFGGLFKPEQPKPYVDSGDGITRCPHCHWELEDGLNCAGCGYIFHPDSATDYSGSDLSDTDYDSMLDEDEDEDEEDEEDEDDMGPSRTGNGRPPQPRQQYHPPFFGFNGSNQERQFLDQLFPGFHTYPFQFPMHPQGVTTVADPGYGGEHDDEWGDRDEEEDDSYEESFIDDEEHLDHEDDASQSDHSTVVGTTRPRGYSPTREAMIRSAYEAAAGSAAPIVRYPPVYHPNSNTSEIEYYGWDSENDEPILGPQGGGRTGGRLAGRSSYLDRPPRNSRASVSTDWSGTHDGVEDMEPDSDSLRSESESEDEDEDEDEDLPRARVGHRRRQIAVLSSDDEENESEDSSSPPRAQIPRATRPPAPRVTRPPPSRTTGSNANNAITIDDSDEDPVGPIRRPGQRRQPRYSPY